jgi:predicted small lipoprotein YifL
MLHSKVCNQTVILNVKSSFALPAGLALLLTLSACGQTGPLYMPNAPARGHKGGARTAPPPPVQPSAATNAVGTATTPPAPAAGTVGPSAESNANNTQATQPSATQSTQQ